VLTKIGTEFDEYPCCRASTIFRCAIRKPTISPAYDAKIPGDRRSGRNHRRIGRGCSVPHFGAVAPLTTECCSFQSLFGARRFRSFTGWAEVRGYSRAGARQNSSHGPIVRFVQRATVGRNRGSEITLLVA